MPKPAVAPPGARESNAGDDFHVLWATRRALELIQPRGTLQRLVMEGLSPLENAPAASRAFLGVDLTEYHGGDTFSEASVVVVSQLKYSTRQPDTKWTVSRLAAGGLKSPLRRLADILKGLLARHPRDEVVPKLRIRLVSNQPVDAALDQAITAAQAFLTTKPEPTQTGTVLKRLDKPSATKLQRLHTASGLRSIEFTDFLRVLDVDQCGTGDRVFQRLALMRDLGQSVTRDRAATLRGLYDLVMHEAQPERAQSTGLTRSDVLAALEVAHDDDLFPSPAAFSPPVHMIRSRNAQDLAALLMAGPQPVLAHGDAGVGKTTTALSVEQHLPAGSKVILYDCFGGGDYLHTGEGRHTPRRFITQVVNELALACGTPFLLRVPDDVEDLWRHLRRTLNAAARVLEDQGGVLVLAVDAADNAALAARLKAAPGFLPDLWSLPLPARVRLLVSCRTHRRSELGPNAATPFELTGFDEAASGEHLRLAFPGADQEAARQFHAASGGNPRMQSYAIDRATQGAGLPDVFEAAQQTPAALFGELVEAAVLHAPDPALAEAYTAALVCLGRPVRIDVFAKVFGLTEGAALDFCRAFSFGVVLQGQMLTFRDEDFESYLRGRFSDEALSAAHGRLAAYFQRLEATDRYAAEVLAEHLWGAHRYQELVALALADQLPVIGDALVRTRVRKARLLLGLQAAQRLHQDVPALKISLILAEVSRADDALTKVVQEFPALAARFGDPAGVGRLYVNSRHDEWLGPAHMRIAALLAQDAAWHTEARWHLDMAYAWLRRWSALDDNERRRWRLPIPALAYQAEAIYRLSGAEAAHNFIRAWRPPAVMLKVVEQVADHVVPSLTPEEVHGALALFRLPGMVEAPFLAALYRAGHRPERERVRQVARRLARLKTAGPEPYEYGEKLFRWQLWFCLLCVAVDIEQETTLELVQRFTPKGAAFGVRMQGSIESQDEFYRFAALQAKLKDEELTLEMLLPERFRGQTEEFRNDRREYGDVLNPFLPLYTLWARAATQAIGSAELDQTIQHLLEVRKNKPRWYANSQDAQFGTWAAVASDAVLLVAGSSVQVIGDIAEAAMAVRPSGAPFIWTSLARRLTHRADGVAPGLLLLERVAAELRSRDMPARDRWALLLECAGIATPLDADLGEGLYREGVAAAESLDDDTAILLSTHADVAIRIARNLPPDEGRELAARLARALEAHTPFVSDEDQLPFRRTMEAVVHLDPQAGLALCSRWDDERRQLFFESVPTVVKAAVETAFLTPLDGLGLLRLAGETYDPAPLGVKWLTTILAAGTSESVTLQQLSARLSTWIRRDLPPERRGSAAEQVAAWATTYGQLDLPGLPELIELLGFVQARTQNVETVPSHGDLPALAEESETVGTLSPNPLLGQAVRIWRTRYRDQDVEAYFQDARSRLLPRERANHLTLLTSFGDLGAYDLPITAILKALQTALSTWRRLPAVQEWASVHLRAFLQGKFVTLTQSDLRAVHLDLIAQMPLLDGLLSLLLQVVSLHGESLSSRAIYELLTEAMTRLPVAEAHEVLLWSLSRFEQTTQLPAIALPELPSTAPQTLAHFYWAVLGHPDVQVRWRGLHGARQSLLLSNSELLSAVLGVLTLRTAGAFRASHLQFYWLSARAYGSLLLARIAEEQPTLLVPHLAAMVGLALDQSLPHMQVRAFCKRAVQRVLVSVPGMLPPDLEQQIAVLNEPKLCSGAPRDEVDEQEDEIAWSTGQYRFNFDPMDTLPYWYGPLGEVFGLSRSAIARQAEVWILDRWHYGNREALPDARRLQGDIRYEETSHRHGTLPRQEDLQTYLEFNAMLCVAGDLIDKHCVVRPKYRDQEPGESWAYWLSHYLDTDVRWWLDDLREPTPLRGELWSSGEPLTSWLDKPMELYEQALGSDQEEVEWLCVHGSTEVCQPDRKGETQIYSALVSPSSATSLLRALATAKNPDDFCLPYEDDEREIEQNFFVLKGWLSKAIWASKGIDELDPLRRDVEPVRVRPGRQFTDTLTLRSSPDGLQYFAPDDQLVGKHELWNDDLDRAEHANRSTAGHRLWVRTGALRDFLRQQEKSLIIEVRVRRSQRRQEHRGEWEYDRGTSKIFVLNADGKLETLDRCRDLGRNHRPGAAPRNER